MAALAAVCALGATSGLVRPAHATILTFDQVRLAGDGSVVDTISGFAVPEAYGDRVTGPVVAVPGGSFTYGDAGEGFTPNVVADFYSGGASPTGPAVSLWQQGYGSLENVLFGNNNSLFLATRLSADAGFTVTLYGFDLGGWFLTDYTIDAVRVRSDTLTLFEAQQVLVHGASAGPGYTSFHFTEPLEARDLLIEIDYRSLPGGQHDNIGIDNIRFGQAPPPDMPSDGQPPQQVPEPSTLVLCSVALLRLVGAGRRARWRRT